MVVGCGALGNEVLKNLVLSGVRHLVCVDFDKVEEDNLSRSVLFSREDAAIGRLKVEAVASRLREMAPDVEVDTVAGDIAFDVGLGRIADMDVVLGCVDSRWARFMINRHCLRTARPWVEGGISMWEGSARVFIPGQNCYACGLTPEGLSDIRRRMPCANVIRKAVQSDSVPTSSFSASVIGAVLSQEALKLVCGEQSLGGRMFSWEGDVVSARTVEFSAWDDDCPEHECRVPAEKSGFNCGTAVSELLDHFGDGASLALRDDCFVDYVVRRADNEKYEVMCPGRKVEDAMAKDPSLCALRAADCYQNEYRTIDSSFPYPGMTLGELGIPADDILDVRVGGERRFIRMGDRVC